MQRHTHTKSTIISCVFLRTPRVCVEADTRARVAWLRGPLVRGGHGAAKRVAAMFAFVMGPYAAPLWATLAYQRGRIIDTVTNHHYDVACGTTLRYY